MVGGELQQGGALLGAKGAAAKRFFQPGGKLGIAEVAVGRRDDQRGARDDAQDLRDALARLKIASPPGIRWV